MQMMYEIIARELRFMKLNDSHPQDYLNFYCLGNREKFATEVSSPNSSPSGNGDTVIVIMLTYALIIKINHLTVEYVLGPIFIYYGALKK